MGRAGDVGERRTVLYLPIYVPAGMGLKACGCSRCRALVLRCGWPTQPSTCTDRTLPLTPQV